MGAPHEIGFAAHVHVARADVRGRSLPKQAAIMLEDRRAFALVDPHTTPRLWARTAGAILAGFERGLASATGPSPESRLRSAVGAARQGLLGFCRTLIERTAPDASLVAGVLGADELAGVVVGEGRVYQHRRRKIERLSPRQVSPDGLLRAPIDLFRAPLSRGTVLFAGSETAFGVEAIERSGRMLERDRNVVPQVLATLLTASAERTGSGAAVIVLRLA